jgi:hypothetical protein
MHGSSLDTLALEIVPDLDSDIRDNQPEEQKLVLVQPCIQHLFDDI